MRKWNKYLRVSGICILLKMSIRLSTSTKGPVKQLGGGSSVQRWAAEGGKGNAPPVTILLKIRHKIANTNPYKYLVHKVLLNCSGKIIA